MQRNCITTKNEKNEQKIMYNLCKCPSVLAFVSVQIFIQCFFFFRVHLYVSSVSFVNFVCTCHFWTVNYSVRYVFIRRLPWWRMLLACRSIIFRLRKNLTRVMISMWDSWMQQVVFAWALRRPIWLRKYTENEHVNKLPTISKHRDTFCPIKLWFSFE